uniref:Phytanoyl-CoA hydroxylase-interacting protein-like C-terminal domain-containing protein n=1 Tax=Ditylenchus dipsaci TaxID=166011 RepID=A0A915EKJ8_9BILA
MQSYDFHPAGHVISTNKVIEVRSKKPKKRSRKRREPANFLVPQFEKTNKRLKLFPSIGNAEVKKIAASDEIGLQCTVSAVKCLLNWKLPPNLVATAHHQELTVDGNSKVHLGLVNEYFLNTSPGESYHVKFECSFKAIFSLKEMHTLFEMAQRFSGTTLHPYEYVYRRKPQNYFTKIRTTCGNVMKPYLKDNNGQSASTINRVLDGLFFGARLQKNGEMKPTSPLGEMRMQIPVEKLLQIGRVNMYFSDFYCNYAVHYVTLVICKKWSTSDLYCRERLILLLFTDNNFLKVIIKPNKEKRYCVNLKAWVEIYYTEEISITDACMFDKIEATGRGCSKQQGLPHKKSCF